MRMAEIGRRGETGVDRAAFSPEDRAARRLLFEWAEEHGLETFQDPIGNLFLRYAGRNTDLPCVLTGSHLDSQPTGGRFDGVFGVLAGLEAVATLAHSQVRLQRSIEVVAWSNEEGCRFAPGTMGSQVFAGHRTLAELGEIRDASGTTLSTALAETLAALPEVPVQNFRPKPSAYVEAHIEQGPRLEQMGVPIGVVSGIQGCLWLEYDIRGVAAHAGTTPHDCRQDALEGALGLIDALRKHCLAGSPECRFTVGRLHVEPNTPNTIPGRVTFTVDFRSPDPALFEELSQQLRLMQAPEPLRLEVRKLLHHPPKAFAPALIRMIDEIARDLGYGALNLVSGAFHDAYSLVHICPVGMIFVRCRGGVSHNAQEFALPHDLGAGTQVLTHALVRLAECE